MDDRKEIIVAKSIAFTLFSLNVKEKNGDNRGEIVEELLRQAGGAPKMPWCVATANFIYLTTCKLLGITPLLKPGLSSSNFINRAKNMTLPNGKSRVIDPDLEPNRIKEVTDGCFVVYEGEAYGTGYVHTGFVWTPIDDKGNYETIEGNKNNTVAKVKRNLKKSPCKFIKLFD